MTFVNTYHIALYAERQADIETMSICECTIYVIVLRVYVVEMCLFCIRRCCVIDAT